MFKPDTKFHTLFLISKMIKQISFPAGISPDWHVIYLESTIQSQMARGQKLLSRHF